MKSLIIKISNQQSSKIKSFPEEYISTKDFNPYLSTAIISVKNNRS
jgi:hypothetical protein